MSPRAGLLSHVSSGEWTSLSALSIIKFIALPL
jgi:hypothetical protein